MAKAKAAKPGKRYRPSPAKAKQDPATGRLEGREPFLNPENAEQVALIRSLAQIHCTMAEAASVLKVARETFTRYVNEHPAIREAWDAGLDEGKASLRRAQFKSALGSKEDGITPNVTAQIWLGKQILGQTDNMALTGPKGGPLETRNAGLEDLVRALDGVAATRAGNAGSAVGVAADGAAKPASTH